MRLRRRVLWVVAASVLVTGGFTVWWATRPTPYQAAYQRIRLGMSTEEVEAVVSQLPDVDRGNGPTLVEFVWEGSVDGQPQQVNSGGAVSDRPPEIAKSVLFGRPMEAGLALDQDVFRDKAGRVRYTMKRCHGGPERLVVLYSVDGRVVEKAYGRFNVIWWEWVRAVFGDRLPF